MITMRQARRAQPKTDQHRTPSERTQVLTHAGRVVMDGEFPRRVRVWIDVIPRRPLEPFRAWARRVYRNRPPSELSPKLRFIVHGAAT